MLAPDTADFEPILPAPVPGRGMSPAMAWTWYLLSQHPAAEAKLHSELDAVLGGRAPTHGDLSNLPYTRMVIEESMRIYPAVPAIEREALADDVAAGRKTRAASIRSDSRPREPRRAHASPICRSAAGGGCIGAAFATADATVLLATLAQRFSLRLVPGHNVEPQALITLRARHGMKMLPKARSAGVST